MFSKRSDGRYQANYKDEAGHWKTITSKDPEKLYQKLQAINNPEPPSFSEIADFWERKAFPEYEEGTLSCYAPALKRAVERMDGKSATEVTPEDIKRHLVCLKDEGFSAKTVSIQRSVYRLIFREAIQNDQFYRFIKDSPADKVTMPKHLPSPKPREAPEDEVVEIIKRSVKDYFGLFPLFVASTGFRRGEALAVRWMDVDFANEEIHCEEAVSHRGATAKRKQTKTKAGVRTAPLLPDLKAALVQPKDAKPTDYIFHGEDPAHPLPKSTYERRWIHYCIEHGFVEDHPEKRTSKQGKHYVVHHYKSTLTAHHLRHAYATLLFEAGVDELSAQHWMGHANIATTHAVYTHLRSKKKNESAQKLKAYSCATHKTEKP